MNIFVFMLTFMPHIPCTRSFPIPYDFFTSIWIIHFSIRSLCFFPNIRDYLHNRHTG